MSTELQSDERAVHAAVNDVINRVLDFDDDTRRRVFRTAETFLFGTNLMPVSRPMGQGAASSPPTQSVRSTSFSESEEASPKEFLFQKQPQTDVERVACLAYYLTHYRDKPHFKTVDISLLNTEAAQVKFSNAAYAVVNAANAGLLVSAGKGAKQLSAQGERYVATLPDRVAAKEVMAGIRSRRSRKSSKAKASHTNSQ